MLPDMKNTLKEFEQDITLIKTTQTIIDFEPVNTEVEHNIKGVVQVADNKTIQVNNLDFGLSYFILHIRNDQGVELKLNDILAHKSKRLKIVRLRNNDDYGFYKGIGEQLL